MAEHQKKQDGMDDIRRGNVGTGDQNSGDVRPDEKVTKHTGEMKGEPSRPGKSRR
jgi:hypothetical protein